MRYFYLLFMLFFLVGCPSKSPQDTKPQTIHNEGTKTYSDAKIKISVNNEVLNPQKTYTYSNTDSAEIGFPEDHYVYVWEKRNDSLKPLAIHFTEPGDGNAQKWESLKNVKEDISWILITSKQKKDVTEKEVREIATQIPEASQEMFIRPFSWCIYQKSENSTLQKVMDVKVYHSPFSMQVFAKKPGENQLSTLSDNVKKIDQGTELQFKLKTHQNTHLALFLCYTSQNNVEKVVQIFPDGEITNEVKKGTTLVLPSHGSHLVESTLTQKWIYCFDSKEQKNCQSIYNWLSTKARGYNAIVSFETGEVQVKSPEANILGANRNIVQFDESVSIDKSVVDEHIPHLKIGLQTK